jgi:beta-phosphoglucomutase
MLVTATRTALAANEIQSVIFDMDGVIIDSHPAHRKAWQQFLTMLGKEVEATELDFILDGRKRCEILRHFVGEMSDSELAEFGRIKDDIFQQVSLEVQPVPGVLDFIEDLKRHGIKLAVATSASYSRTHSTLQRMSLKNQFATIVTGDDVAEGKPNPAIYNLVRGRLGTDAGHCLVVEDAASAIQAARQEGFTCLAIGANGSTDKLRAAGANCVIENFVGISLEGLQTILLAECLTRRL